MDDLLKGLINLGVGLPNTDQVIELLESSAQATHAIAQLLALSTSNVDDGKPNSEAVDLMGAELLTDAVNAILNNFKNAIEAAKSSFLREQAHLAKPTRIKTIPRKAQIAKHEAALARMANLSALAGDERLRLTFDGGRSYVSYKKLAQLRRISVTQMTLAPKRYDETYLVVRLIARPVSYQGVQLLGEDEQGSLISIALSHVSVLPLTSQEASKSFPLASVVAIKEPYLSLDHASRAVPFKPSVGVRIDSPTDLVSLSDDAAAGLGITWTSLPPAAHTPGAVATWLSEPPLASWLASRTGAPAPYDSSNDIRLRLETLLQLQRPGAAWRELCAARKARLVDDIECELLELEGDIRFSCEDFHGAAQAFERAQQCSKAIHDGHRLITTSVEDRFPSRRSALRPKLTRTAHHALAQNTPPSFSEVCNIYFNASAGARHLDTRTYVGPVEVRDIPGAGRGLILTEDVEAGRTILLCKAVEAQYPSGTPCVRVNLEMGLVSTTSQIRAQTGLIHALVDRPELQLPVLGLTAGPSLPYSDWVGHPYPLSLPAVPSAEEASTYERPSIDAAYIDGVLRFNAFGPSPPSSCLRSNLGTRTTSAFTDVRKAEPPPEEGRRTMPHPLPALLNHSCYPNVSTTFHGDILLSRALRRLKAGTEVLHQYVQGEQAHAVRRAQLSKHGFECRCYLCELDLADGSEEREERARVVAGELPAVMERSRVVLKMRQAGTDPDEREMEAHRDISEALQGFVRRIERTYAAERGDVKPDLFEVLHARAAHLSIFDHRLALQCELLALRSVGAIISPQSSHSAADLALSQLPALHLDGALTAMLHISRLLHRLNEPKQAQLWARTAAWAHECIVGGGVRVLRDRFGSLWEDVLGFCEEQGTMN